MIDIKQLQNVYAAKLLLTKSHDAAFLKSMWTAYQQGVADATAATPYKTILDPEKNDAAL
jgi:hypothetical protein